MKIALATDHAGFELKEHIKKYLIGKGHQVEDFGAFELNPGDDYPDFISKAAEFVSKGEGLGIIFGKSGAGETIVANKYSNVRAVTCLNEEQAKLSREDNDANVLSLGSGFVANTEAERIVDIFINTPFSNEERHLRRVKKISQIELSNS